MAYPYNSEGVDAQYGAIERALRAARKRFDTPRVDASDDFLAYKAGQDPYGNQPWQPTPVYKHEIIRDLQEALGVDAATADVIVEQYLQGGGSTGNQQIDSAIRSAIETREGSPAPSRSPSPGDRAPAEQPGPGSQPSDPARSPAPGIGLGLEPMGNIPIGNIEEGLSFDQSRVPAASPLNVDDVAAPGFTPGSLGTLGTVGYGSQNEATPSTGFSRTGGFAQPSIRDRDVDWYNDPRFAQNPMRESYGPQVPASLNAAVPTPDLAFNPQNPAISLDVATPALSLRGVSPDVDIDVSTPEIALSRAAPSIDSGVPTRSLSYSPQAPSFDAVTPPNSLAMRSSAPDVDIDVATPSLAYAPNPRFDVEAFGPEIPIALTIPEVGPVAESNVTPGQFRGFTGADLAAVGDVSEPNVGPGFAQSTPDTSLLGPFSAQRAALGPLVRIAPVAQSVPSAPTAPSSAREGGRGVAGPASELTAAQDYGFNPATIQQMTPGQRLSAVAQGLDSDVTRSRSGNIAGVVMHETAGVSSMPRGVISAANERNAGAHYYVDLEGVVHQMVPDNMVIGHADAGRGHSRDSRPDLRNANTIGIEIQTAPGKKPNEAQVRAAMGLTRALADKYGFNIQKDVVGHGELSNNRESREGMGVVNSLRGAPTDDARAETTLSDAPGNRASVPVRERGVTRGMGRQSSLGGIINSLLGIQSAEAAPMGSAMGVGARGAQQQASNPAYAVDDMMGVPEQSYYDRVIGPLFNPNVRSLTVDPGVFDDGAAGIREIDPGTFGNDQIGPIQVEPVAPISLTPPAASTSSSSGGGSVGSGGYGTSDTPGLGSGGPGIGAPGDSNSLGGGPGGTSQAGGTPGVGGAGSVSAGLEGGGTPTAAGAGATTNTTMGKGPSDALEVSIDTPANAAGLLSGMLSRGEITPAQAAEIADKLGVNLSGVQGYSQEAEETAPLESVQVDFMDTPMSVPAGIGLGLAPAGIDVAQTAIATDAFGGIGIGPGALDTASQGIGFDPFGALSFSDPMSSPGFTGGVISTDPNAIGDDTDDSAPTSEPFGGAGIGQAAVDTAPASVSDTSDNEGSPAGDGGGVAGGGMSDPGGGSDPTGSGGIDGSGGFGGGFSDFGGGFGGMSDIGDDNGDTGGNDFAYGGLVADDKAITRALRTARKMHRKKKADGGKVTPGGEIIHSAVYKMPNGYMEETVIQRALKAATRR